VGDDAGPLATWSATQLATALREGTVSAADAVEACLARIEQLEPIVHAFLTVLDDAARADAAEADRRRLAGEPLPPLHGIPFAVKDAFTYPGTHTTVGSTMLQDFAPDRPAAACIRNLQAAGAIFLGKNNVGSGMAPPSLVPARVEPTRNPWNLERTAGGSSSGSAACVALGMAYGSVGTDLGGSVRNPASFCGVVGLKPTHGLVPLDGNVFGMGTRAEHVGPMARSAGDIALLLPAMAGQPVPPSTADPLDPAGVRVAVVDGGGIMEAVPDVRRGLEDAYVAIATGGFPTTRITLPPNDEALWLLLTLFDEWKAYEQEYTVSDDDQYRRYIAERLRLRRGRSQQWVDARTEALRKFYDDLFRDYDILALGTAPITARRFDELVIPWDGGEIATADLHSVNTWAFNLTGQPVVSVPVGFDDEGLPIGLQLVARRGEDALLLRVAERYEQVRGAFPFPDVEALAA
jgi:aspartyl-tRNA(Asn)/glutamyl-tRNA(Gln) amidotransferase subunit A